MKTRNLILAIMAVFWGTSCDPAYEVQFKIDNKTESHLVVTHRDLFFPQTGEEPEVKEGTTDLPANSRLILKELSGIGQTTSSLMNEIDALRFDSIFIEKITGEKINIDVMDISNWDKIHPSGNSNTGIIQLVIDDDDF